MDGQTVGAESSSESASKGSGRTTLSDIDSMEPIQFQNWVLDRLKDHGFDVNRTPVTGDHGADGVATSRKTGTKIVVQCKHTQGSGHCSEDAVKDLIRAADAYGKDNTVFVAVTNAASYSNASKQLALQNKIVMIDRDELLVWPSAVAHR